MEAYRSGSECIQGCHTKFNLLFLLPSFKPFHCPTVSFLYNFVPQFVIPLGHQVKEFFASVKIYKLGGYRLHFFKQIFPVLVCRAFYQKMFFCFNTIGTMRAISFISRYSWRQVSWTQVSWRQVIIAQSLFYRTSIKSWKNLCSTDYTHFLKKINRYIRYNLDIVRDTQ